MLIRVGPEKYDKALSKPNTRVMDFTGRPMRGYVYVEPLGYRSEKELKDWVKLAVDFVSGLPSK
ncbi:MAG TPA: hypothetical protein VFC63_04590 [Blastocatellia bacterium]|nr:hypothetical protein [Blastocatellia bacterium]